MEQFSNHLRGPHWRTAPTVELKTRSEVAQLLSLSPARVAEIELCALLKLRGHLIAKLGELSH